MLTCINFGLWLTMSTIVNVTWWAEQWAKRIDELVSVDNLKSVEKLRNGMKAFARKSYRWGRIANEWSEMLRSILSSE